MARTGPKVTVGCGGVEYKITVYIPSWRIMEAFIRRILLALLNQERDLIIVLNHFLGWKSNYIWVLEISWRIWFPSSCFSCAPYFVVVFELVRFCCSLETLSIHFQYSRYSWFPPPYNEVRHEQISQLSIRNNSTQHNCISGETITANS